MTSEQNDLKNLFDVIFTCTHPSTTKQNAVNNITNVAEDSIVISNQELFKKIVGNKYQEYLDALQDPSKIAKQTILNLYNSGELPCVITTDDVRRLVSDKNPHISFTSVDFSNLLKTLANEFHWWKRYKENVFGETYTEYLTEYLTDDE